MTSPLRGKNNKEKCTLKLKKNSFINSSAYICDFTIRITLCIFFSSFCWELAQKATRNALNLKYEHCVIS